MAGTLYNDAVLSSDEGQPGRYHAVGDPTEGALVVAAAYAGIKKDDLEAAFPRVAEVPFDSVRKRMTTVHRTPQTIDELPDSLAPIWERRVNLAVMPPYIAFTKGAIDGLLNISGQVWVEGDCAAGRSLADSGHDGPRPDGRQGHAGAGRGPAHCLDRPPDETTDKAWSAI